MTAERFSYRQMREIADKFEADGRPDKARVADVAMRAINAAEYTIGTGMDTMTRRIAEVQSRMDAVQGLYDAMFQGVPAEVDAAIKVRATNWQMLGAVLTESELKMVTDAAATPDK